jgi:DNA repair exonuclease SbcCD ATPase subunit
VQRRAALNEPAHEGEQQRGQEVRPVARVDEGEVHEQLLQQECAGCGNLPLGGIGRDLADVEQRVCFEPEPVLKEYRYYRCVHRDKHGTAACPAKPLPAPAVEQYVADRMAEATADGTLVAEARAALERYLEEQREQLVERRAELPAKMAAAAASVAQYVEELRQVEGRAREVVARRLEQESERLATLEESLAEVERFLEALEEQRVEREWAAQVLGDFARVWDMLIPANQGRLLRALVERVVVDEQRQQVAVHLVDLTAALDSALDVEPTPLEAEPQEAAV